MESSSNRNSGTHWRKKKMMRRISIAILGTACFMLAGLLLLAWRPSIVPIEPASQSTFSAELVAKGEALLRTKKSRFGDSETERNRDFFVRKRASPLDRK